MRLSLSKIKAEASRLSALKCDVYLAAAVARASLQMRHFQVLQIGAGDRRYRRSYTNLALPCRI